jgi:hypothetical protein
MFDLPRAFNAAVASPTRRRATRNSASPKRNTRNLLRPSSISFYCASLSAARMPSAAIQRPGTAASDAKPVSRNSFQATVIAQGGICRALASKHLPRSVREYIYVCTCVDLCCAYVNFDGGQMQKGGAVYCAPGCKRCSRVTKCAGRRGGGGGGGGVGAAPPNLRK